MLALITATSSTRQPHNIGHIFLSLVLLLSLEIRKLRLCGIRRLDPNVLVTEWQSKILTSNLVDSKTHTVSNCAILALTHLLIHSTSIPLVCTLHRYKGYREEYSITAPLNELTLSLKYTYKHASMCAHTYAHAYAQTAHTCMHMHSNAHVHRHTHVHTYIHAHVCTHKHIHMHTE